MTNISITNAQLTDAQRHAKWLGKWILQVPVYLATNYLVRWVISFLYRKTNVSFATSFFVRHPLDFSLVAGFLGGVLAVLALHLFLRLPKLPAPAQMAPWKKAQAWAWVFAAAWFLYGVAKWWSVNATHSVLATSGSGVRFSDLTTVFFGSACDLTQGLSALTIRGCGFQLAFTSPLFGCIAYSLAAFVPTRWLSKSDSKASDQA